MFLPPPIQQYYQTDSELEQFRYRLKQQACPHCRRTGCLILHGYLYGYPEENSSDQVIRGRRFFCCNRHRQKGCGGTFSLLHSDILRRFIIRTKSLWSLLKAILDGHNVRQALALARPNYSLSSGYRLLKRFIYSQSMIRSAIISRFPAHQASPGTFKQPFFQTILDLSATFPHGSCPIQTFQQHFQISFLVNPV